MTITIADAAHVYRISRRSIYRAINEGRMTSEDGRVCPGEIEQLIELGVLGVDRRQRIAQHGE